MKNDLADVRGVEYDLIHERLQPASMAWHVSPTTMYERLSILPVNPDPLWREVPHRLYPAD